LSSDGWRRLTFVQSPISDLLVGLWRLTPISQIQSSTGTGSLETGRKYRKGIGQVGMKLKGPTSGTQGAKGNRLSHFEIVGDDPCADKSPYRKQPQICSVRERRVLSMSTKRSSKRAQDARSGNLARRGRRPRLSVAPRCEIKRGQQAPRIRDEGSSSFVPRPAEIGDFKFSAVLQCLRFYVTVLRVCHREKRHPVPVGGGNHLRPVVVDIRIDFS
jgi:hypothetical protein